MKTDTSTTCIIVFGTHTEETKRRFRELPGCSAVFAEKTEEIPEDALQNAEIFVGHLKKSCCPRCPNYGFCS